MRQDTQHSYFLDVTVLSDTKKNALSKIFVHAASVAYSEICVMGCYHPLKAFVVGYDSDGKKQLKIVPYSVDGEEVHHLNYDHGDWFPAPASDLGNYKKVAYMSYTIPCGQCIGCRLDYSRQWANRLMLELSDHDPDDCWFLTLTYDDEHVPKSANIDTGELTLTLNKRDVQLFHKRLRKEFDSKKVRFFLAGEYGEKTSRPHYHGIYFSLHLEGFDPTDPRNVWCKTPQGFTLYHWSRLDEIWSNGRVIIAPVTWDTCAYTARYVCKKLTGPLAEYYETFGLVPEFSLMSRKPGIARNWYENLDEFDPTKKISIATTTKGLTFSPPRYFKELWKVDNQLESDIMSYRNSVQAAARKELIQSKNDFARSDWLAYLCSVEESHKSGVSKLDRSECDFV